MQNTNKLSSKTLLNFTLDIFLILSALFASISGTQFLFHESWNHRRGQIPVEGMLGISDWRLWDIIHTWTGALMIFIAVLHLLLHWNWVVSMTGRYIRELFGRCECRMNWKSRLNIIIDGLIGVSFFVTAISGIYFMYFPNGGRYITASSQILFTRTTWSLIHLWAGVVMILAFFIHLAFHWRWLTKVTGKILRVSKITLPEKELPSSEPVR